MILPKIKINNLNPDNYQSNDQLKSEILAKNMSINSLLENDNNSKMDVIFIDKSSKSALLKVTPNIRETVMKNQIIYLDLESHHVSDSFRYEHYTLRLLLVTCDMASFFGAPRLIMNLIEYFHSKKGLFVSSMAKTTSTLLKICSRTLIF